MRVLVTGANGFIGQNLCVFLGEQRHVVFKVCRETEKEEILSHLSQVDIVFHLAGANRPANASGFETDNVGSTRFIIESLIKLKRPVPVVLTSSIQAETNNEYGRSKYSAEKIVQGYSATTGAAHYIFRLPNVFGKWCKPNYNSFVATFCNNIQKGIDITVHDPEASVKLAYIDDVCAAFITLLDGQSASGFQKLPVEYHSTVGEVADIISSLAGGRTSLISEHVGAGLVRALSATYLSYTSPDKFSYPIPSYRDERGVFCEMLKTKDSGQFSFFTAHPGITRGGHYHHTKNEKFLVLKGEALFKFQDVRTGHRHELKVSEQRPQIVESVPGWTHDITNCGTEELIVMLWANEIFDRENPDTVAKDFFDV